MPRVTDRVRISRVRADGQTETLGWWLHGARTLELTAPGFPFLGPGRYPLEGELPWVFWDMSPSGYLGRRLAARPQLRAFGRNPRDWMAGEVLEVLQLAGAELAGNLLVGEQAVSDFHAWRFDPRDASALLAEVLRDAATEAAPSSLGGERPKLLGDRFNGSGYLMKFSPPPLSPQGARWADLLHLEALCARTLNAVGVRAVHATAGQTSGRTTLVVDRFDRLARRGRRGAATLYWLAMERWGDVSLSAPEVTRRLALEGLLDPQSAATCARVHAFSAAIGNDDAHLGNYGLLFDDEGRASLAPLYDVLPMRFAPRNDELPDEFIAPRALEEDGDVSAWVDVLARSVAACDDVSLEFRRRWLRWVSRPLLG